MIHAASAEDSAPTDVAFRQRAIVFIASALESRGCVVLQRPVSSHTPLRMSFEAPTGERIGVLAYAFPLEKSQGSTFRFQLTAARQLELAQDPLGLYATLLLGIDLDRGFFVGADPLLHSPVEPRTFVDFKKRHVDLILKNGWHEWEREQTSPETDGPIEVLVGGTSASFLRYVRFEREALGEDQGHRQLLAERSLKYA